MRHFDGDRLFGFPNRLPPASGRVLVANPFLEDGNFKRTVILLVEHTAEGTVGFVVNRPLELALNDIVSDLPTFQTHLSYGGPVQVDTLHFLHRRPEVFPTGTEVVPGVHWGGNYAQLQAAIEAQLLDTNDIRFFVGYAGWSAGQLEEELAQESWVLLEATEALVFETDPQHLWQYVLESLGGRYATQANFPSDPRLN